MDWIEKDNKLYKQYTFANFVEAVAFMTECAFHIEKINHHPEWSNVYNRVSVYLTTHDVGNQITDKDRKLAELMDACSQKYKG